MKLGITKRHGLFEIAFSDGDCDSFGLETKMSFGFALEMRCPDRGHCIHQGYTDHFILMHAYHIRGCLGRCLEENVHGFDSLQSRLRSEAH